MSLEAVMLVLDNSAFSLNGDYPRTSSPLHQPLHRRPPRREGANPAPAPLPFPFDTRLRLPDSTATRLAAQADAVHILFNNKLNANPENEVGLMVMAGKA